MKDKWMDVTVYVAAGLGMLCYLLLIVILIVIMIANPDNISCKPVGKGVICHNIESSDNK